MEASVMSWLLSYEGLAFTTVVGSLLISWVALIVARGLSSLGWEFRGETGHVTLGCVSAVFSIALGLVVVAIWNGHSDCQNAQTRMAEAIVAAYQDCDDLDTKTRQEVQGWFLDFSRAVSQINADDLQSVNHTNPTWGPLYQARAAALAASKQQLSDVKQVHLKDAFASLIERRHVWAASFSYKLHPLLWTGLLFIVGLLAVGMAAFQWQMEHQRWSQQLFFVLASLTLIVCGWGLGHPLEGVFRVDFSSLSELQQVLPAIESSR
jgi:hypothetical protein